MERIRLSYKNESSQYYDIIRTAGYLGIDLKTLHSMSMKMLVYYRAGVMQRLENEYNNSLSLEKFNALKTAQAVWGNKHFNDKVQTVDWTTDLLPENHKKQIARRQAATLARIKEQYGVDLTRVDGGKDG